MTRLAHRLPMQPRRLRVTSRLAAVLAACSLAATSLAATPDPAKTRAYIDRAWTTLTRSQEDCAALADPPR